MRRVGSFRQDDCAHRPTTESQPDRSSKALGGGPRHSQSESLHETARPWNRWHRAPQSSSTPSCAAGWESEAEFLEFDQGLTVYPPPFTVEGKDLAAASRAAVPHCEPVEFFEDAARQIR
jgi:hypothetical protein